MILKSTCVYFAYWIFFSWEVGLQKWIINLNIAFAFPQKNEVKYTFKDLIGFLKQG